MAAIVDQEAWKVSVRRPAGEQGKIEGNATGEEILKAHVCVSLIEQLA